MDLIATNQSSCWVQSQWNWTNTPAGNKWSAPFQAYRYKKNYTPDSITDTYDTGDAVIVTKNRLRGAGRALSLYIYSETGKDCQLLGWGNTITGGNNP